MEQLETFSASPRSLQVALKVKLMFLVAELLNSRSPGLLSVTVIAVTATPMRIKSERMTNKNEKSNFPSRLKNDESFPFLFITHPNQTQTYILKNKEGWMM